MSRYASDLYCYLIITFITSSKYLSVIFTVIDFRSTTTYYYICLLLQHYYMQVTYLSVYSSMNIVSTGFKNKQFQSLILLLND